MSGLNRVAELAKEYSTVYNETDRFRRQWNEVDKDRILLSLQHIVSVIQVPGKWSAYALEPTTTNMGSVTLGLSDFPYGLIKKTDLGSTSFFRRGGSLIYLQKMSGKILVLVELPRIDFEDGTEGDSPIVLGTYAPSEIDPELIAEHASRFLEEVIKWHNE